MRLGWVAVLGVVAACSSFSEEDAAPGPLADGGDVEGGARPEGGSPADAALTDVAPDAIAGLPLANPGFETASPLGGTGCGPGWVVAAGSAHMVMLANTGTFGCEVCVTTVDDAGEGAATIQSVGIGVAAGNYEAAAFVRLDEKTPEPSVVFLDLAIESTPSSSRSNTDKPTAAWSTKETSLTTAPAGKLGVALTVKGAMSSCAVFDDVAVAGPQ